MGTYIPASKGVHSPHASRKTDCLFFSVPEPVLLVPQWRRGTPGGTAQTLRLFAWVQSNSKTEESEAILGFEYP